MLKIEFKSQNSVDNWEEILKKIKLNLAKVVRTLVAKLENLKILNWL